MPRRRALVANDVAVAGVIHKIGWRGLPSLALAFGDRDDCRGWLVGEPHKGISYMFQMMNEARIMVGVNGASHRVGRLPRGARLRARAPAGAPARRRATRRAPQVPIVEHADVRRMLLRQKAIVEGALALVAFTSKLADLAQHAAEARQRARARRSSSTR